MNTILQKRIEEKSKELGQMFFPDNMNVFARPNWEAGYIETACKEIANFALQNQWISVDEDLPEETEDGFCDDKFVLYCSEYPATASYNHKSKKWYWGDHEILGVTHWMPIPSMEGSEE